MEGRKEEEVREFTKGEWKYDDLTGDVVVGNRPVAIPCETGGGEAESMANGDLISAAPDLLKAAELAYEYMTGKAAKDAFEIALELEKAIAKARSEKP